MMPIITAGYSCREIVEASSAFLDGEMTWSEWARFRIHIMTCPPCAEYVRQLGLTVDSLRSLPNEEGQQLRSNLMELFDDWSSGRLPDDEDNEDETPSPE
ncbi:MAG: zf-HC2 domain-containing protein [Myxococcota bacterium]